MQNCNALQRSIFELIAEIARQNIFQNYSGEFLLYAFRRKMLDVKTHNLHVNGIQPQQSYSSVFETTNTTTLTNLSINAVNSTIVLKNWKKKPFWIENSIETYYLPTLIIFSHTQTSVVNQHPKNLLIKMQKKADTDSYRKFSQRLSSSDFDIDNLCSYENTKISCLK